MKKRMLGKTGLLFPEIGMGCWAIGGVGYGPVSEADALQTLEAAWDGGVRLFDTADTYGEGRSEERIAQFLKSKSRDDAVIATKAGWDFYHGGHKKNFDSSYLRFACEQSLKRLRTDYIDLYQLHNPSLELIESGGAVGVLADLKAEGKIGHIGVSVHTEAEALAALGDERIESLQLIFNMLDQRMAREVFQKARSKKIGILVREPLACGLLTGKYDANATFPKDDHRRRYSMEKLKADTKKNEKIKNILYSRTTNHAGLPDGQEPRNTLGQAALEFVLSFDAVSAVIPGAKNPEQMNSNLRAGQGGMLSQSDRESLQQLFATDPLFLEQLLPAL